MKAIQKTLPESDQVEIKKVLGGTGMQRIRRVVLSLRDEELITASEERVSALAGSVGEMQAIWKVDNAAKYQTFINVLDELSKIAERDEKFTVVVIEPTT